MSRHAHLSQHACCLWDWWLVTVRGLANVVGCSVFCQRESVEVLSRLCQMSVGLASGRVCVWVETMLYFYVASVIWIRRRPLEDNVYWAFVFGKHVGCRVLPHSL